MKVCINPARITGYNCTLYEISRAIYFRLKGAIAPLSAAFAPAQRTLFTIPLRLFLFPNSYLRTIRVLTSCGYRMGLHYDRRHSLLVLVLRTVLLWLARPSSLLTRPLLDTKIVIPAKIFRICTEFLRTVPTNRSLV